MYAARIVQFKQFNKYYCTVTCRRQCKRIYRNVSKPFVLIPTKEFFNLLVRHDSLQIIYLCVDCSVIKIINNIMTRYVTLSTYLSFPNEHSE